MLFLYFQILVYSSQGKFRKDKANGKVVNLSSFFLTMARLLAMNEVICQRVKDVAQRQNRGLDDV